MIFKVNDKKDLVKKLKFCLLNKNKMNNKPFLNLTPPVIILSNPQLGENIGAAARAMKNCGFTYQRKGVIINMAPADIRKEGSAYD